MTASSKILVFISGFVGIGALGGGLGAIINPQSPMGMPMNMLKNSPFPDFLLPGIILFTVIGLGNLTVLLLMFKIPRSSGYGGGVMGCALMIWIVVQCIMLQSVGFLHVLYFIIGGVQAFIALFILYKNRQFPVNILLNLIKVK